MDKYLLSILQEVNTIIIPGLGALTLVNADKGEYMFMSFLKHDDGQLAAYIAEKEGKDENEAKNIISKYVREILATIDKGESYDMFQFGSFRKDESGEVSFVNWNEISDGEETPQAKEETIIETPTPVIETSTAEIAEPEPEIVEPESITLVDNEIDVSENTAETEEDDDPPYEEAHEALSSLMPSNDEIKEEEKPVEKVEEPVIPQAEESRKLTIVEKEEINKGKKKIEELKAKKDQKPPRKKKGAGFYILILLLLALATGGTLFGINYQEWKQHIPFLADKKEKVEVENTQKEQMEEMLGLDKEEEEAEENVEEPTSEEEVIEEVEEEVQEPEKVKEVVKTPPPANSTATFHAIAGAFSSKDNADRLSSKLQGQGYPAFVSQRGAMYWVSMKQFNSKDEASSAMAELKVVTPSVWLFAGNLN